MTQRDRIVLTVLVAVATAVGAFMFVIKPKRAEVSRLDEQAAQAQTRRDTALASLANAKQARAQFADAQVGIARLGKAVPTDDDTATIVYQLEQTARRAGIDFRSLRFDSTGTDATPTAGAGTSNPDGASTAMTKVPFKLVFQGTFFDLRKFLKHMNSFTRMRDGKYVSVRGRLLATEGVSLTAASSGFPQIKAQIAATAYSAPAPSNSTSSTTTSGTTSSATTASGTSNAASTTSTTATSSGEAAR